LGQRPSFRSDRRTLAPKTKPSEKTKGFATVSDVEHRRKMSAEEAKEAAKALREFRTSLARTILTFLGVGW
jgi:hypothetical protein